METTEARFLILGEPEALADAAGIRSRTQVLRLA